MNFLVKTLLSKFNFWELMLMLYHSGGKSAVERFITPSEAVLNKIRVKGTRMSVILDERDEFVEEAMEMLEAIGDPDFIDPDPEDAADKEHLGG